MNDLKSGGPVGHRNLPARAIFKDQKTGRLDIVNVLFWGGMAVGIVVFWWFALPVVLYPVGLLFDAILGLFDAALVRPAGCAALTAGECIAWAQEVSK